MFARIEYAPKFGISKYINFARGWFFCFGARSLFWRTQLFKVCWLRNFCEKFIRKTYNVGLKPPRLDRCSICWALEGEIEETDDVELKSKLQKVLDEHRKDAFQVRDYVYTSFQKSYAQLGKPSMNLETLEECID